jgi:hypothetical protein
VGELVRNLVADLEEITVDVRNSFDSLTSGQINWKSSSESWSVGQCLEHLIKINSAYFRQFDEIIKWDRKQTFWENYSPFSGFFGNLLYKNLSPKAERKLKAPETARPSASELSTSIVADFSNHQTELIGKIKQTENLDTRKIIITSPFIKAITYSLFDAYGIIVTHERRHIQQAKRVTKTEGFPD